MENRKNQSPHNFHGTKTSPWLLDMCVFRDNATDSNTLVGFDRSHASATLFTIHRNPHLCQWCRFRNGNCHKHYLLIRIFLGTEFCLLHRLGPRNIHNTMVVANWFLHSSSLNSLLRGVLRLTHLLPKLWSRLDFKINGRKPNNQSGKCHRDWFNYC